MKQNHGDYERYLLGLIADPNFLLLEQGLLEQGAGLWRIAFQ